MTDNLPQTHVISAEEAEDGFQRMYGEHYGPYGAVCINTGQFDAGVCWKCKLKGKDRQIAALREEVAELKAGIIRPTCSVCHGPPGDCLGHNDACPC